MSDEDKVVFMAEPEDHPGSRFHFTGGMAMRNDLGLWRNDTPLTQWMGRHGIWHADDRSAAIFKAMWCRLHGIVFDVAAEAERNRVFWADSGCKPDGSPLVRA